MNFSYKVRDPLGNEHDGTIEASSPDAAQQQLRQDGFRVLVLEEDSGGEFSLLARGISKREIIYATSQLAIMVDTGITLSVALESIVEQEQNPTLRKVLSDLKRGVESGEDFSSALERHPKHFDHTYVSLVKASEATGTLGAMLERIAGYLGKEMDTRSKVRGAMAYPAVTGTLAVCVTLFLLIYILPKFAPMFDKKGMKLPSITIFMMSTSHYLIAYWYAWLIGAATLIGGFLYGRRTETGRQVLDWVKIHTPILGGVFRKVTISRSIRTLGTMIAAGVSVIDALQLSADVAGNYYYETVWRDVLNKVTSGSQIYEALAESDLFPPMLIQMIRSGEETGKLDLVLEKVSSYYDLEVDHVIKTSTGLIEPIMITVMGVVVGGIAMGLLLPIFSLGRAH